MHVIQFQALRGDLGLPLDAAAGAAPAIVTIAGAVLAAAASGLEVRGEAARAALPDAGGEASERAAEVAGPAAVRGLATEAAAALLAKAALGEEEGRAAAAAGEPAGAARAPGARGVVTAPVPLPVVPATRRGLLKLWAEADLPPPMAVAAAAAATVALLRGDSMEIAAVGVAAALLLVRGVRLLPFVAPPAPAFVAPDAAAAAFALPPCAVAVGLLPGNADIEGEGVCIDNLAEAASESAVQDRGMLCVNSSTVLLPAASRVCHTCASED